MIDLDHSITVMFPVSTITSSTSVQLRLALLDPSSSDLVLGLSASTTFSQPALSSAATLNDFNTLNYLSIMDLKISPQATALKVGSTL